MRYFEEHILHYEFEKQTYDSMRRKNINKWTTLLFSLDAIIAVAAVRGWRLPCGHYERRLYPIQYGSKF